jgi:cytochrome bd-type quinol oxidase subunit 1
MEVCKLLKQEVSADTFTSVLFDFILFVYLFIYLFIYLVYFLLNSRHCTYAINATGVPHYYPSSSYFVVPTQSAVLC